MGDYCKVKHSRSLCFDLCNPYRWDLNPNQFTVDLIVYLHLCVCQSGRPTKTLHIKGNYFNEQKLTGLVCFFNLCVGFF